jgi:IS30 family transposase
MALNRQYGHLTLSEREIVRRMLAQDCTHAMIARVLGKSRATVSR